MEQIGEEVDIAKTTLYRYFPSKEAIVAAFFRQSIMDHSGEIARVIRALPETRSRLIALCRHSFEWAGTQREMFLIHFSYRMQSFSKGVLDESERSGTQKVIEEILSAGQKVGEIRHDIPVEAMAATFALSFGFMITWLLATRATAIPEGHVAMTVDLFLTGAASPRSSI